MWPLRSRVCFIFFFLFFHYSLVSFISSIALTLSSYSCGYESFSSLFILRFSPLQLIRICSELFPVGFDLYLGSVDQFFECIDGLRNSHSALGNSGMWNWTCSVFSAITAASNLASGSLHVPPGKSLQCIVSNTNLCYSSSVWYYRICKLFLSLTFSFDFAQCLCYLIIKLLNT